MQVKPENAASSIRVLSPGDGGDVTQSNDAVAIGAALNGNETKQSVDQTQGEVGLLHRVEEVGGVTAGILEGGAPHDGSGSVECRDPP